MVGHEAGAYTVRRFAELHADDVAGMVLLDPAHGELDDRWTALDNASWQTYVTRRRNLLGMASAEAAAEFDSFLETLRSGAALEAHPAAPVVIISGQRPAESPRWVGETPAGLEAKGALHQRMADELRAELLISTRSGGNIHLEDPDLVIETVIRLLDAVSE
jgi:pimeloyl-ACP methyl ester carboxylesterase